jgi:ubiquinone/menaquinone biosynthesis C-methylase UbiE
MKDEEDSAEEMSYGVQHSLRKFQHRQGGRKREDQPAILNRIGFSGGLTVVDLGCGDGYYAIPISRLIGPHGTVYAVDKSSVALSAIDENLGTLEADSGNIRKVLADMSHTNIESGSVDIIFIANSFHNAENKQDLIKEIRRLIRMGGRVVDIDWLKMETPFGPPYSIRLEESEVESLFREYGFLLEDKFYFEPYHYCLTFRSTTSLPTKEENLKTNLEKSPDSIRASQQKVRGGSD